MVNKSNNNKKNTSRVTKVTSNNGSKNTEENIYDKLIQSVIDTYIVPIQNGDINTLNEKSIVPSIVNLLHQSESLKHFLNDTMSLSTPVKVKWFECIQQLLRPQSENEILQSIGIQLLCETIRVCNYNILSQKVDQWINALSSVIEAQKKLISKKQVLESTKFRDYSLCIVTLSLLIEKSCKFNDLKRTLNTNLLASLVTLVLTSLEEANGYPLDCKIDSMVAITVFIDSLSTTMKPFLVKIETLCYPYLYSSEKQLQDASASVIAKLSQCVGINSTDFYWDVVVQKITLELYNIVDKLYMGLEDLDEAKKYKLSSRSIQLPSSNKLINLGEEQIMNMLKQTSNVVVSGNLKTTDSQVLVNHLLNGFQGCSNCLVKILSTPTLVPCPIPIDEILTVLCRVLNVSNQLNSISHSTSEFSLSQILILTNRLHLQSYIVLQQFIKIFKKQLLPHIKTISELLQRPIRNSHDNNLVMTEVYQCIQTAIESFGSTCNESIASPLIPFLLHNIKPDIPNESNSNSAINVGNNSTQNLIPTLDFTDPTKLQDEETINHKTQSLQLLSTILLYCGNYLVSNTTSSGHSSGGSSTSVIRLEIDQVLLKLSFESQTLFNMKKNNTVYQNSSYSSWRYRYYLYESLMNSLLKPVQDLPPLLPYALRIFTTGLNQDLNIHVKTLCCQALSICQSLIHPQNPSLLSPTSNLINLNNLLFNQSIQQNKSSMNSNNIKSNNDIEMNENEDEVEDEEEEDEDEEEEEEEEEVKPESKKILTNNNNFKFNSTSKTTSITKKTNDEESDLQLKSNLFSGLNFNNNNQKQKITKKEETNDSTMNDSDDEDLPDII
ncbi:hypothetical protein DLAC_08011 [Tieghemostelium lacteum]|uniref:Pre-rRNA-processing protein RIX1 N-terminal domain-containing protein n=1 Tax=Tieghemostelium lacteum TaxID=361077 RepID=A0A151ZAZ4_TIELA|nr:hypothetical protein DLAC_08011 [Tieghemostelium lacteum]|eukprot:KYQ91105.1 hypothetical protein DLAC_08011 [Tieghemostelium lacteum]